MSGSWVDGFLEATNHLTSPLLFRKWGAISVISGALERKVWVKTKGSALYPNLYTVLVAPPGVGKTEVTWRVRAMWDALEDVHVANSSVTKAALIDSLDAATRRITDLTSVPPVYNFNTLLVAANELGVLLPAYENEFMNTLTDLYDCKGYSESRRTKDIKIKIERPSLSILAACTPGYLKEVLPPGAWDQGFLSRTILVYSGEQQLSSLFHEEEDSMEHLVDSLKEINALYGQFKFTAEAKHFIDKWYLGGQEPKPDHPRLLNYNTRRITHLLKLAMVASVSYKRDLVIDLNDVNQAMDWLIEVEFHMTDIFKAMGSGGDSQVIEEAFYFLYRLYMEDPKKQPILEHRLVLFLQERTPVHNIVRMIETMVRSNMIEQKFVPGAGNGYIPRKPVK